MCRLCSTQETLDKRLDNILELSLSVLGDGALLVNGREKLGLVGLEVSKEVRLPLKNLVDRDGVEVTVDTSEDKRDHLGNSHGAVLLLLEKLGKLECCQYRRFIVFGQSVSTYTLTTVESLLGSSVQIRTKLREGRNLTVLGQEKLERTGNLFHGLELGGRANTRNRKTDIDRRSDTLVEQLSLQEDLTISDGNNVGRNVSGDITALGLYDRQCCERAAAELVVHLGSTLEETGVKIENITGISLTSRGTSEKQGHLAVSDSLLGKIVKDNKSVLARVSEKFA
ncbi:unnamed protein product [Fusarium graminearum]|nr:unnamed protein product [Fusarium graminearum]VTO91283.1 unnamed protein product [Fusarium graminearum]